MTHNGQQTSYSYDNNNKLTQLVGPGGTTTFGYDGNGNTTTMVQPGPITTTYGYDYENRLTGVTKPGYTASYAYSADGRRLRVQESNNPNPDRWFQYDGVRPVLESTLNGDSMTVFAKYVWEGNSYYDPLVFSLEGGAWHQYLYDGLGSTRQLINQTDQAVTDTYSCEAFGNLLSSTGTTPNPYRYVGSLGYYQTGSSLMHLGARYYMPEVGRLTSRDPLNFMGKSGTAYGYAQSRPTFYVDPFGEQELPLDPGQWDGWVLGRIFGPQDDPYFIHFPAFVWNTWGKCFVDCMDPVEQVCEAGAKEGAKKAAPYLGTIGKLIASGLEFLEEIDPYLTAAQVSYCATKCANDLQQKKQKNK